MVFALIEGDKGASSREIDPVVFGPRTGSEDRLLAAKERLDDLTAEQSLLMGQIKRKLKALTVPSGDR